MHTALGMFPSGGFCGVSHLDVLADLDCHLAPAAPCAALDLLGSAGIVTFSSQ